MPEPDRLELYRHMVRARRFEEACASLWEDGLVSGELHLGVGEEAVAAGVVAHLRDGDGLAADHRPTPPFLVRGVDAEAMFLELLGSTDGLCGGQGGHMHLLDPDLLAASDGIVGASAPLACGFALQAQLESTGGVAVAFFGEGAANQGMLLESLNLAAVWSLPVVFVCKDSALAITTGRRASTAGSLVRRARAFGVSARRVDGSDATAVWRSADRAIRRARRGAGPTFLLCRVHRPDGHLLPDPLLRPLTDPVGQLRELGGPLMDALQASPGAPAGERLRATLRVGEAMGVAVRERLLSKADPVARARRHLDAADADRVDDEARDEIDSARAAAVAKVGADVE